MDNISALMDGELDDQDAQRQVARLKSDGQSRSRWDEFHLVGDALRGEPLLSSRFNETFSKRLAEEPTVLAPRRIVSRPRRIAAYALSAAASLSAAALVAWVALAPNAQDLAGPVPAVAQQQPIPLLNVPNDGSKNEYLLAHEDFSPSTRLQGVAPYIRTVSTTRQGDGR